MGKVSRSRLILKTNVEVALKDFLIVERQTEVRLLDRLVVSIASKYRNHGERGYDTRERWRTHLFYYVEQAHAVRENVNNACFRADEK